MVLRYESMGPGKYNYSVKTIPLYPVQFLHPLKPGVGRS